MTTCPTCGSQVRVYSADEGTQSYEPAALDVDDEPTAEHWLHALILHVEHVHGCTHTADARQAVPALTPTEETDR